MEPQAQRVAHLRRVYVAARPVRDPHHHRRRYHERRLLHATVPGSRAVTRALVQRALRVRFRSSIVLGLLGRRHGQLDALAHAPVLQVIRAPHRQPDVLARDNLVVVLRNHRSG